MQKAVEDKVFSIMSIQEEEEEEEEEHNLEADMIAHQDEYINVYEDKVCYYAYILFLPRYAYFRVYLRYRW